MGSEKIFMFGEPSTGGRAVLAVDKSRDEKIANLEKSVSGINDSIEGLKELILGLNKKE